MTSSNGNIFRVTGHLCGEFIGPGEFPAQRPVTRSFDVFFDLRLNKRLSKQLWGWWLETLSWTLWRHLNAHTTRSTTNIFPIFSFISWTVYGPIANTLGLRYICQWSLNTREHKMYKHRHISTQMIALSVETVHLLMAFARTSLNSPQGNYLMGWNMVPAHYTRVIGEKHSDKTG